MPVPFAGGGDGRLKNIGMNIESRLINDQYGKPAIVSNLAEAVVAHNSGIRPRIEIVESKRLTDNALSP